MLKSIKHQFRMARGKRNARQIADSGVEIKLELGAGAVRGENGWVTVDWNKRCDVYWDLTVALPFPADCVSQIYTSHTLEHLTYHQTQGLLKDCLRVLKPGGEISICVPNARHYIEAYYLNQELEERTRYAPAWNYLSPIDYVNYTAYMAGEHKHMFDQDNLVAVLQKAGFENGAAREFNPKRDIAERDFESVYAFATKTAESQQLQRAA
ncbi:MAG: methyltransferase domain-containing protein [Rubripirellula sp.]